QRLPEDPHQLEPREIPKGEQAGRGRTARARATEPSPEALRALLQIEAHPFLDQPADDRGSLRHERLHQLRISAEAAAAPGVVEVALQAVVGADRRLDA